MNFETFFLKKIRSKKMILLHLIALWCICTISSFLVFYSMYNHIPKITHALIYNNMTFVFSLPKALSDLFHISNPNSLSGIVMFSIIFWGISTWILIELFKKRYVYLLGLISIIFFLASLRWLIVSIGMSGI